MALADTIEVRKAISETIPGVGATTTQGVPEELPLSVVLAGALATTTQAGAVKQAAFIAAAPVPFADLTAAANYVNSIRTALINAGLMAAS